MSIIMRSGCSLSASATPASASSALSTVCPAFSSRNVASVMFAGLSSTTSTFAISNRRVAMGDGSPDFARKLTAGEVTLFQNGGNESVQFASILGGDRLGGDAHDPAARAGGLVHQ